MTLYTPWAIAGMFLGIFLAGTLILLLGGAVLRAAVAWYNKLTVDPSIVPLPGQTGGFSPNITSSGAQPDASNPFASPMTAGSEPIKGSGVPEPGYLYSMGIILVTGAATVPLAVVVGLIPIPVNSRLDIVLGLAFWAIHFLLGAAVLKRMLPTPTFGRGVLIYLLNLAIWIIIAVVITVALLLVAALMYVFAEVPRSGR